ncbi:hypothetical protein [[Clostridium] colinum]|uniref:hypothetical protein n=1 Tax=[Clostridium] colinum TaxID=36835 RepID=UPI002024E563|nr:hypothetical protein [[Clostridium] colinum]
MKILEGYNKRQKIKLAKYKNTSIEMLNELVKDEDIEVRIEVYGRKDFINIKDLITNLNQEEYEIFMVSIKREKEKNDFEYALNIVNNTTKIAIVISSLTVSVCIISSIILFSAIKLGEILNV